MQIFPRTLNILPLALAVGGAGAGGAVTLAVWYYFSPANFQVGYAPKQPVAYSHWLHAGELGIDCRYCHANVEVGAEAMVPPTQTCVGCHAIVRTDSPMLGPVRDSWTSGKPIEWVRVHQIPDHAYFDHSAHVNSGVGCVSCHGRVDRMEVVEVDQPISMGWCLNCHRDPSNHLRPKDRVTDMQCALGAQACTANEDCCSGACSEGACQAYTVADARPIIPPEHCSGCHR